MDTAQSDYEMAKSFALMLLRQHATPEKQDVLNAVNKVLPMCPGADPEALCRDLETVCNIWTPDGSFLQDAAGHESWLPDKRAEINWDFWRRYELYLEQDKEMPPQVLTRLDGLTDRILELLEDPKRPGVWDRRGMVVGQVQSGKTANYTGLICKAADAGYKLIIVFAGIHNSLRSQTQLRLDEGFLGRDTKQDRVFRLDSPKMGVGRIILNSGRTPAAHSLTTSDERGDFKKVTARGIAPYVGNDPVVLVVKKNGSILKNLLAWIRDNIAEKRGGIKSVPGTIPLLLLDDEADNASINTKQLEYDASGGFKNEQDVTKINGLIRQLLKIFDKSAYVGYTATPFANIFIPPDASTGTQGDDLFPRSFIINLPAPSNYIGPVQVFGLDALDSEISAGLPITRPVRDAEDLLPGSHKKTLIPTALPDSLREAIRAFILVCAARMARGQTTVHNSMLVHVTRFVDVQRVVRDLAAQELLALKNRLQYGDGAMTPALRDELKTQWKKDFVPTTLATRQRLPADSHLTILTWDEVEKFLIPAALKIDIKEINGTAKDVLEYYDNPGGISVIAIGGDKLSRGLTLEGLSVSYYLRASRMYDTLMQMGRWFGYRPGYADLCRLYTTPELADWYAHITVASEELRNEFDVMAAAGLTPLQYGLKVRTHPGGLTITSAGKIRYGTKIRVSFSGQLVESHRLLKAKSEIDHNFNAAAAFIAQLTALPSPTVLDTDKNHYRWKEAPSSSVVSFLSALHGNPQLPPTPASDPQKLAEFILKKNVRGELTEWTVVLVNVRGEKKSSANIGGINGVGLSERTPAEASTETVYVIRNRHILTESHEMLDLSEEEINSAVRERQKRDPSAKEPNGPSVRAIRPRERGLLLLYPLDPSAEGDHGPIFPRGDPRRTGNPIMGFAISFPGSPATDDSTDAVEYMVDQVYVKEYLAEEIDALRQEEALNNDPS